MAHRGVADEDAADELVLYLDNDYQLYKQKEAIAENLLRKIKRGAYDHARAPDAWAYVVEEAAKKYAREFARPGEWSVLFNVPTRRLAAVELADRWYANARAGRPDEV
jgi:hypothetical protein